MTIEYPIFKPGDLVRNSRGRRGIIKKELPELRSVDGDHRVYEILYLNAGLRHNEVLTYSTANMYLTRMSDALQG